MLEKSEISKARQADRISEVLLSIRPDVTANDRREAAKKLKCSGQSITQYLSGNVYDEDKGTSLVVFFKAKIAERDKELEKALA